MFLVSFFDAGGCRLFPLQPIPFVPMLPLFCQNLNLFCLYSVPSEKIAIRLHIIFVLKVFLACICACARLLAQLVCQYFASFCGDAIFVFHFFCSFSYFSRSHALVKSTSASYDSISRIYIGLPNHCQQIFDTIILPLRVVGVTFLSE